MARADTTRTVPLALRPALAVIDRLRTASRLTLIVALMALPAVYACWAYAGGASADAAFADAELRGVQVAAPAVRAMATVAAGRPADLAGLEAAARRHPDVVPADLLETARGAVSAPDASSPAGRVRSVTALQALVTGVADASNLTLDPDLDSYYVMDTLLFRVPAALTQVTRSRTVPSAGAATARLAEQATVAGGLTAAVESWTGNLGTAAAETRDDGLGERLRGADPAPLQVLADRLTRDLVDPRGADPTAALAAADAAGAAVEPLAESLSGLLQTRRDGIVGARNLTVAGTLAAVLLACWVATAVIWRTRRDVALALGAVAALREGDLTDHPVPGGGGEFGDIGRGVAEARQRMRHLLDALRSGTDRLREASESLVAGAGAVRDRAHVSADQATSVAASAHQVSGNVTRVSAGTEQMGAAVTEISGSAGEAARVAGSAVEMGRTARATVAKLGQSSQEITGVVNLITSIAAQTNLLALNATIEAARAGDAGRGFAVVANEVKELARATAGATDDIGRRVAAIQEDAVGAVGVMEEINAIVAQISDYQSTIAAAVEEQTATTSEMMRGLAEAASGSSGIADVIAALATATAETTDDAGRADEAARDVGAVCDTLQREVAAFRC